MLKINGSPSGGRLSVSRDLSGGVRIVLAGVGFVMSPQEAIGFATALLKYAGVDVTFESAFGPIRTDAAP